jgi:hypothetical protein
MAKIRVPIPSLQIDFSFALSQARTCYLQDALRAAVGDMKIKILDQELSRFAPADALSGLAMRGLRGELLFVTPSLLRKNPRLLGYYRLLLGFSQKAFYGKEDGLSRFKGMEDRGMISETNENPLDSLCLALNQSALELYKGIGPERASRELLDDLTLLTLGPQLRGGANVKIGLAGIAAVFEVIHRIVATHALSSNPHRIELINAARRKVFIEFASDPDIIIREQMDENSFRNVIAIEIKGGKDFSNIHNRLGEAEKSHQKARKSGYVECWTVVNVDRIDLEVAKRESPSSNRFYRLVDLESAKSDEYRDFRNRIIGLTGIPTPRKR